MDGVYRFLGEEPCAHDFNNVEQTTFEDDFVYGFKDLHIIRQKVEPQPHLLVHAGTTPPEALLAKRHPFAPLCGAKSE
jgi:hypothetical protein